jgi:hypothetical protein
VRVRPGVIDQSLKDEAVRRVESGERALTVGRDLGISVHTVLDECRRRGVTTAPKGNPGGWKQAIERRPGVRRARSEQAHRITKEFVDRMRMEYPESEHPHAGHGKPATRGECISRGLGTPDLPCPYVSCVHHAAIAVEDGGSIRHSFPDRDPDDARETCTLAVADRGGATLDEVASVLNVVRERARQIEAVALANLRARLPPEMRDSLDSLLCAMGDAPSLPAPVVRRYLPFTNKTLTSPTLTSPVLGTPASGDLSNCTADGTNAVGFKNIPQNSQSTAYTLVLADAGKHILHHTANPHYSAHKFFIY